MPGEPGKLQVRTKKDDEELSQTGSQTSKASSHPSKASSHPSKASSKPSKQENPQKTLEKPTNILLQNGYDVGHTIGNGSYAVVKTGFLRKTIKVAIKCIQKSKAPKDYLEKFLSRELDIVKRLKHPNIVSFIETFDTANRVYIVLELAEKGDLLDAMNRMGAVPEDQSARWFSQIVKATAYCHEKGVVHRDLKMENVLLDKQNNVKLTDFGFARDGIVDKEGFAVLSETYCGSYSYAAPEILQGMPYDPRKSDIWSLGVILFIMVIGRFPFDDTNHRILVKQTLNPVVFPPKKPASDEFKALVVKIFTKHNKRISLEDIQADKFLTSHSGVIVETNA